LGFDRDGNRFFFTLKEGVGSTIKVLSIFLELEGRCRSGKSWDRIWMGRGKAAGGANTPVLKNDWSEAVQTRDFAALSSEAVSS
jgi:hypothetical protein